MTTAIIIYFCINIFVIFNIMLYGARPAKSLSWILIVLILPFAGALLYLVFGINRRRFKFFTLKQTTKRKLYDINHQQQKNENTNVNFASKAEKKLATLIGNSSRFYATEGNSIQILNDGEFTFETIFKELEKAEKFIHLQYYIFEEGEILDRFYELLSKKIEEGVEIRIIYDAIGSFFWKKKSINRFKDLGIHVYPTMPLHYGSFLFTLNYRNHRKIIVIDGKVGFTGGVNITDKYIKPISPLGIWDDIHVRLEGPAVDSLHRVFIKDYFFASNNELLLKDKYLPKSEKAGDKMVQIVSSGPDSNHPAIMQQYIEMINLAEEYIYISNPYFIPNSAMLEAIRIAALSDVRIKLLVPSKLDSWLAKHSMFSFFQELLFVGVEIYLQNDNFLHSKLIIMDGKISSIGSGNFDHRSFEHNFETNALLFDEQITDQLCQDFINGCDTCEKLELETYKNRSMKRKLMEGIARFFSPLL